MALMLSTAEVRVLGCLIEKEATTPDSYPLTLNSLTNACNQKSNRDPVLQLSEADVMEAAESLLSQGLVMSPSVGGGRVVKYAHRLKGRLRDELNFTQAELAVLGVLFVRGAQTVGELRTRSARIHAFANLEAIQETLHQLETREDGPYCRALPRLPGQKEGRIVHLFADIEEAVDASTVVVPDQSGADEERIAELETQVAALKNQLEAVSTKLDDLLLQLGD